jgi:hypothetical protein
MLFPKTTEEIFGGICGSYIGILSGTESCIALTTLSQEFIKIKKIRGI